MKDLYLIYVNMVGKNYQGDYLYEFIFSDTTKNIDGNEWDTFPASGRPEAPHDHLIKKVGRLESELNLDVIQESDTFAGWDMGADGIQAISREMFISPLIKAIQEQQDLILSLKARLDAANL